MTINQHISNLRALIKKHSRNPDVFSDALLYSFLSGARSIILEQNENKANHTSEWDITQFPIKLVKTKSHLVGCVTYGCDVLRSEYKIPRALLMNIQSKFKVSTYDYTNVLIGTEQDYQNSKYDDIKSKLIHASIINEYLIIWNKLNLKSVLVSGIWEDVLDWAMIPFCDMNGNTTSSTCYDARTSNFPLSETHKLAAYDIVLQKLGIPLKLQSDQTNDSNSEM